MRGKSEMLSKENKKMYDLNEKQAFELKCLNQAMKEYKRIQIE